MAAPDRAAWKLVANGDLGDVVTWKPAFEVIEEVHGLLCSLEELGEQNVDWDLLLAGLPRFGDLRNFSFPPLYSEDDFDLIDGFLTLTKEPSVSVARMTYVRIRIYVDRKQEQAIISDFQKLKERLDTYEPLLQLRM
jgi:hypothetical protein